MQLQRDGIEVAEPARDRGVDLIAYLDRGPAFRARPIQIKATLDFRWIHHSKYATFPGLIMAHVMLLGDENSVVVFATTYRENHAIAQWLGYLKQKLWTAPASGEARVWKQSRRGQPDLVAALQPHLISPGRWRQIIGASRA